MKKIFLLSLSFIIILKSVAQEKGEQTKKEIRIAADLKSGTSQDALISFFKLAYNDLSGDRRSLKFESSLFAIRTLVNKNLWIDSNFVKQNFSRNFVLGISPSIDSNLSFKSNTLSLKYAIVNKRDKMVIDLALDHEKQWILVRNKALTDYINYLYPSSSKNFSDPKYVAADNFFSSKKDPARTKLKDLPADFLAFFQQALNSQPYFAGADLDKFRDHLYVSYDSIAQIVAQMPLLTVQTNIKSTKNTALAGADLGVEYLRGVFGKKKLTNLQLNIKGNIEASDDSIRTTTELNRIVTNVSIGIDWTIARTEDKKMPWLTLKLAPKYSYIVAGKYTGENEGTFTATAVPRLRISEDVWVPVEFEYDPVNGKFFGFLSMVGNFDALIGLVKGLE